jgi:RNA polymerase sigma-70 factor, ECF subfamily
MIFEKKKSAKELFKTYSGDVLNYSYSILKDYDDAEDAVQEVFMQFMKSENIFRGECSYKTWLLTITRNYCYQKINKNPNHLVTIDANLPDTYEMSIDASISLNDALAELPVEEYELIYLRAYAGYSYNEISEVLNVSIDNVKVKLFRVRQKLRKYLK